MKGWKLGKMGWWTGLDHSVGQAAAMARAVDGRPKSASPLLERRNWREHQMGENEAGLRPGGID
jgi:hypothetical protein